MSTFSKNRNTDDGYEWSPSSERTERANNGNALQDADDKEINVG